MNEIVAKFISDCKNSGKTFVALNQVPYEVIKELARRCRCASRRRWCSAALSGSTTAGGTTFSISARPRRPTLTPSGWPRRYTSFSTMSGHDLNSNKF